MERHVRSPAAAESLSELSYAMAFPRASQVSVSGRAYRGMAATRAAAGWQPTKILRPSMIHASWSSVGPAPAGPESNAARARWNIEELASCATARSCSPARSAHIGASISHVAGASGCQSAAPGRPGGRKGIHRDRSRQFGHQHLDHQRRRGRVQPQLDAVGNDGSTPHDLRIVPVVDALQQERGEVQRITSCHFRP
jgi:hypothetical protein